MGDVREEVSEISEGNSERRVNAERISDLEKIDNVHLITMSTDSNYVDASL